MSIKSRKRIAVCLATAALVSMVAACSAAPSGTSAAGTVESDFIPCLVSDSGGFNDHSFNQSGHEGLLEGAAAAGVQAKAAESKGESDYAPNIQSMVAANCNLVATVGFPLKDATEKAAKANPDVKFVIVDDNEIKADNVKPIIFDTGQAAFLAGYAAASYSKTRIVGTFGGMQIPSVTLFMDGFAEGVAYFNQQAGKSVKVVGWDVTKQNGSFTGGFDANETAKNTAQGLLDQNADVIMPVGGPIYQSAAQAMRDSSKKPVLIGVDADVYLTDPSVKDLLLTSVMKGVKPAVSDVVVAAAEGKFDNTPFVGTLENDGVGIAPFHDFASKVDPGLQAELDRIKAGIIDGSIEVKSQASPKV